MAVFGLLVAQIGRCTGADERTAFDRATVLWAALHGRASVVNAMPGFPFADESDWIALLAGWTDGSPAAGAGRDGGSSDPAAQDATG